MSELLYKIVNVDGSEYVGKDFVWPLPMMGRYGSNKNEVVREAEWLSVKGELKKRGGLVLQRIGDLSDWLYSLPVAVYEARYGVDSINMSCYCDERCAGVDRTDLKNSVLVRKAQLTRLIGTTDDAMIGLFTADFAEDALYIVMDSGIGKKADLKILKENIRQTRQSAFGFPIAYEDQVWVSNLLDEIRNPSPCFRNEHIYQTVRAVVRAVLWAGSGDIRKSLSWSANAIASYETIKNHNYKEVYKAELERQGVRLLKYLRGEVDYEAIKKKAKRRF